MIGWLMLEFLAISGSLRATSSNTTVLQATAALAPDNIHITLYEGLGYLPHFNPDLDVEPPHPAVADLRRQIRAADAVLISSPEYAHGVPGSLKNALDWIVSSGEFTDKPTAVLTFARASYVRTALMETLTVMMAKLNDDTSPRLQSNTNKLDIATVLADSSLSTALKDCLSRLSNAIVTVTRETQSSANL